MKLFRNVIVFSFVALTMFACNDGKSEEKDEMDKVAEISENEAMEAGAEVEKEMSNTIVDVAMGNDSFSTLVTAVKAAGLVETLSAEGPFTVFAPTNDAFAKLPEGTVDNLLKPENKETLSGVLTYHVIAGKFDASTVSKSILDNDGIFKVNTVQGEEMTLSLDGENVMLTDANGNKSKVIMADVSAANGIIHAIDTVVMPKS